jgi:hypothetical protein
MPGDKAMKIKGEVLEEYAISNCIKSEKIFLTKNMKNTADKTLAVKELISPSKRIMLMTSAYHV